MVKRREGESIVLLYLASENPEGEEAVMSEEEEHEMGVLIARARQIGTQARLNRAREAREAREAEEAEDAEAAGDPDYDDM
jgi:hypothetical protein